MNTATKVMIDNTYIFIGGPKNGERIFVEDDDDIIIPVLKDEFRAVGYAGTSLADLEKMVAYEHIRYAKMSFRGWNTEFIVYAIDGLSPDDVIKLLIESYATGEKQ